MSKIIATRSTPRCGACNRNPRVSHGCRRPSRWRGPFSFLVQQPLRLGGLVLLLSRRVPSVQALAPGLAFRFTNLAIDITDAPLELANALADRRSDFRHSLGAKDDQNDHQNDEQLHRSEITQHKSS